MAAIDSDARVFAPSWPSSRRKASLALTGMAAGLLVAVAAFVWHGGDNNAARFSAQMVFRASSVAFLLYYLARPIARLFPSLPTLMLARERFGLALAFVCMYAVFLSCTLTPDYMNGARIPLATYAFSIFSALVLAVVIVGEYAGRATDPSWRAAWRAMESVGVAYFWLVYAINDLDHISGPHRVDHYYGASLTILVLALLVRFADAFMQRYRLAPQTR